MIAGCELLRPVLFKGPLFMYANVFTECTKCLLKCIQSHWFSLTYQTLLSSYLSSCSLLLAGLLGPIWPSSFNQFSVVQNPFPSSTIFTLDHLSKTVVDPKCVHKLTNMIQSMTCIWKIKTSPHTIPFISIFLPRFQGLQLTVALLFHKIASC